MWTVLVLLWYFLPSAHSLICPEATGPVFFVDRLSDKNNHCFENCGNSNCTGVLVSATTCMSVLTENYYGELNERDFIRKHCVQDVTGVQVVSLRTDRILLDHTEKIEKAMDQYHCLALCIQETKFTCKSIMFYNESGDCLLNTENSDSASLSTDTEGFIVTFMERRLPGPSACLLSFNLLKWNEKGLIGDARLHNISQLSDCLALCKNCDFVLFHESYSECFIINEDIDGQPLDFVDDEYQVLQNLCNNILPCSAESSMYIAYTEHKRDEQRLCLQDCMSSISCSHAYIQPDGNCWISPTPLLNQTITVERKCVGIDKLETPVLFEELDRACPSTKGSMKIKGIDLEHCLGLCLTHPTKSCEFVSYYPELNTCHLLQEVSAKKAKMSGKKKCRYFSLNLVSTSPEEFSVHRSEGGGPQEDTKARAHSSKTFNKSEKLPSPKKKSHSLPSLAVETICKYDRIIVKIKSSTSLNGHLFLRNAFNNCSVQMDGNNSAELIFNLNDTERCPLERENHLYKAVVVIKENISAESALPIITDSDRMYAVSCDYGNGTKYAAASRQLTLRNSKYNDMEINGKVSYQSKITMELRAKREQTAKTVTIGQPVELIFHKDKHLVGEYTVSDCIASSMNELDNLTLIEDGCPTRSTKGFIVRGSIQQNKDGFILPLRAFRFKSGEGVRIACSLKLCETHCPVTKCDRSIGRNRRNLPNDLRANNLTEVHAAMLVKDENSAQFNRTIGDHCSSSIRLYSIVCGISILIALQVAAVLYFLIRRC